MLDLDDLEMKARNSEYKRKVDLEHKRSWRSAFNPYGELHQDYKEAFGLSRHYKNKMKDFDLEDKDVLENRILVELKKVEYQQIIIYKGKILDKYIISVN